VIEHWRVMSRRSELLTITTAADGAIYVMCGPTMLLTLKHISEKNP
jgi:hypothetical protein